MSAPPAVRVGFPLDEQLALLPGQLTLRLHEWLVRLGTWMPFAQAADLLAEFTLVRVSESTARRQTQAAGVAAVRQETTAAERILQDYPLPPAGPPRLVVSADGAMVPLRHGVWAEVRTLAIGEPEVSGLDGTVPTRALSYFSSGGSSGSNDEKRRNDRHRSRATTLSGPRHHPRRFLARVDQQQITHGNEPLARERYTAPVLMQNNDGHPRSVSTSHCVLYFTTNLDAAEWAAC